MAEMSKALLAHSIVFSTVVAALFAFIGLVVGWRRRRTTYAVIYAIVGGVSAFGVMSLLKAGETLGF